MPSLCTARTAYLSLIECARRSGGCSARPCSGSCGRCLLACLDERMGDISATLSNAFGSDSLLFWSLYRSIWPNLKRSSTDNMEDLLGLSHVEMSDIDRPWRLVTDGWIDFAEE